MTPDRPANDHTPVRLLLVDDQALLRHSLRIAIDREPDLAVIGEAGTGTDAVTAARELRPDVVLMDIRMPDGDGIYATEQITNTAELTRTRVLVLSMFDIDDYVYGALRAGASGFLLKDARPDQLIDAIRRVHHGESLFAPTILTTLIEHFVNRRTPSKAHEMARVTARETEVLTLVGRGLSNDDIARELTVSHNTVKTHISSLLAKLDARDRAQLVIAAYEHEFVVPTARNPAT